MRFFNFGLIFGLNQSTTIIDQSGIVHAIDPKTSCGPVARNQTTDTGKIKHDKYLKWVYTANLLPG